MYSICRLSGYPAFEVEPLAYREVQRLEAEEALRALSLLHAILEEGKDLRTKIHSKKSTQNWTVSNATLADAPLVLWIFSSSILFPMVGAPSEKFALSLKRHLFPHGGRVKVQAQGFLDLFAILPAIVNIFPIYRAQH